MTVSLIASVLLMAACVMPVEIPLTDTNCTAEDYQSLIGEPFSAVDSLITAENVRILRPGQMATMDYLPDRLNIELDHNDRTSRVYCG